MSSLARILAFVSMLSVPAAAGSENVPKLTNLQPIDVHDGVNPVPKMTADGREGMIVKGFKNYITGDGANHVFLVLTRDGHPPAGWSVVTTGPGTEIAPDDTIALGDAPHTGEDMVGSVRFARADFDGHRDVILLLARRGMEGPIPAASHVVIKIYALEKDTEVGADRFNLKGELKPSACYSNTDLALTVELGLPLPPDYEGPDKAGTCGAM